MPRMKPAILAVELDDTTAILTWDERGSRPAFYNIQRDGVSVATVAATIQTYSNSGLVAGTSYDYRIRSFSGSDQVFSNTVTVLVPAVPVPVAAPVLTATSGSTQVALSWTAVANADSYELQRKTGAGAYSEINDANVLTYLNTGLTNDTTYTYRARATANAGVDVGPWSNEVARTPVSTVPVAPVLTGTAGDSENTLDWNTVANASTYRLRRTVGTTVINFPDTTATDYIDDIVTNDTTYTYAVRGITAAGVLGVLSTPLDLRPSASAPPPAGVDLLIIDKAVLLTRSTSNASYIAMKAIADAALGTPDIGNQDSTVAGRTVAAALVYARTGIASYKTKVDAVLAQVPVYNTSTARSLSVGRQICGYVVAADLVGYRPASFVNFINAIRTTTYPNGHPSWTHIKNTSEKTCSNWGAWCTASRIAADLYIGDLTDLAAAVNIYKGYLGDRTAYSGFLETNDYEATWDCDPSLSLVGINRDCGFRNGAVVEDVARTAAAYPALDDTGRTYSWEGLGGAVMSARLLKHNGYPTVWTWSSNALRRAGEFLDANGGYPPKYSTNQLVPWEINAAYSISLAPTSAAGLGRHFGFTDWLNGS